MKKKLQLAIAASLLAVGIVQADIAEISITASADSSALGYIQGQSYTFDFTVTNRTENVGGDQFIPEANYWSRSTEDTSIFSGIGGTAFIGEWTGEPLEDPIEELYVINNTFGGAIAPFYTILGIATPDAGIVSQVGFSLPVSWDYSNTSYIDPVSYLSDKTGGVLTGGQVSVAGISVVTFTPTSMAVTAIPEPSVLAFVGIFGAGLFGVRRFFLI